MRGGECIMDLTTFVYVIAGAVVIFGIAFILHIRKEPQDAHGVNRT